MKPKTKQKRIERLQYQFIDFDNNYERIKGDTPFAQAVNKVTSDYWVNTGNCIPLEDAMWAIAAHMFNEIYSLPPNKKGK